MQASEQNNAGGRDRLPYMVPWTVVVLGAVSFLTDCSSEMIYPLLPVFLTTQLGASAVALGAIEGVAEATAAVLKLVSGVWVDRVQRKKPLILLGYGISGFARPLIGLAYTWPIVLVIRFTDRIGKGLRSSPRDALIAEVTPSEARGRAFGFHRAMDHAGAVVGPLLASAAFLIPGISIRHVFLLAAIPALMAFLVLLFFVREDRASFPKNGTRKGIFLDWRVLSPDFKRLLIGLLVFTLGNSADAFLLLRMSEVGIGVGAIGILWSIHHVAKMVASFYGGKLADNYGNKKLMVVGWIFYAFVYLGFSLLESKALVIALFFAYGIYFGLAEPAEKSFVSKVAGPDTKGTAFGFYHLTVGIAALPASLVFGGIWERFGSATAFQFGAALALIACLLVGLVTEKAP